MVPGRPPDADRKKGMSALQIHRMMGFGSYRPPAICATASAPASPIPNSASSWELSRRMKPTSGARTRTAMPTSALPGTGIAGKIRGSAQSSRKGGVVARVIANTNAETFNEFVRQAVSGKVNLIATDEHASYGDLHKGTSNNDGFFVGSIAGVAHR